MSNFKRPLSSPEENLKEAKMTKTSLEDLDKKLDLIFGKLSGEISGLKTDLRDGIADLKIELGNRIESVEESVTVLQKKVDSVEKNQDDAYDSMNKLLEVKITGISYQKDENLKVIFATLCDLMGISTRDSPDVDLFRIPGPLPNILDYPIIAKFSSTLYKERFLNIYYEVKKSLSVKKLRGYENTEIDARIYIQPNLSRQNYLVSRCALDLKKKKLIYKTKIKNGLVFVKINSGDKFTHFKSADALKVAVENK
jgi:hypothetical protein